MTEAELMCARDLREKIRDLERRMQTLRGQAISLVPIIDGMPHAKTAKSRVEEITVKLMAVDEEIALLSDEFVRAAFELDRKIEASDLDALEKAVLNLRYVACMNFLHIQEQLKISDATTFYIHRTARKKILKSSQDDSS